MLELWKPLTTKESINSLVTYNVFCLQDKTPCIPVIIFYDDNSNSYYYLKTRSATQIDKENKNVNIVNKYPSEVLITGDDPAYKPNGIFIRDLYIDCAQIFKINKEYFESLVNKEELFDDNKSLDKYYIKNIKSKIKELLFTQPTYLSIIEVKYNNKTTTVESLYLCEELYKRECTNIKEKVCEYKAFNNDTFDKQSNVFNFATMFLKQFFTNDLQRFNKLNNSTIQLPEWKPIILLNNNPVLFDALERKYSEEYGKRKGYLPIIFYFDKQEGYYYYLRSRNIDNQNIINKLTLRRKHKYEVYVPSNSNIINDSFTKETYIDCSEIYKIKKEDFESLVNLQTHNTNNAKLIESQYREKVINKIKSYILSHPPKLSILEVYLDKNITKAKSLYCCDNIINQEFKKDNDCNDDPDYFDNKFNSKKSITDSYSNQRYLEAIKFGFLFMNYFSKDELHKFYKKHKLSEQEIKTITNNNGDK